MKKVFPLKVPGRVDQRVVEAVKNDVRRYVKRELRKTPPEGFDGWALQCRAGGDRESATVCELKEISRIIDAVANAGGTAVYVEIVAEPSQRESADTSPEDGQ